jgi:phospholipase C
MWAPITRARLAPRMMEGVVDTAIGGLKRLVLRLVERLLPGNLRRAGDLIVTRPVPTPTGTVAVAADETIANLGRVDHIVVLMLENRSFDHMLGYLTLEGGRGDIDGLTGSESNSYQGTTYPVHHLDRTAWNGELEDPCHGPECIDQQLANGNAGFVASYAEYLAAYQAKHGPAAGADPGLVMGYYNAEDLPVYDHLAREFCVCDRWFSSVAGATWPNRLYSLAGRADGDRENADPPLYNLPSVFRFLDQRRVDWRFYSFDPATLRLIDAEYRLSHHHNFAYVDRRKLTSQQRAAGELLDEERSFLDDAASGALPAVSWIDPHFKDIRVFGPDSNDDHPPSDVLAGQALVLDVYHALRSSPSWEQSLLIVVYDEHGGIYDHVPPPAAPDGDPGFRRYGARVPALVVSPLVEAGSVAPREPVFDHTSIIKTILLRFCREGDRIPDMGARVTAAHHLGGLLSRDTARADVASHDAAAARIVSWRSGFAERRFQRFDPQPPARHLTELQSGYAKAARALREAGLPAGHP